MSVRGLLLLLVALMAAQAPAGAQAPPFASSFSADQARSAVNEGRHIPLRQVVALLRRQEPGEMLDAQLIQAGPGERAVYRIKWLTEDGRRIDFEVDAVSGQILSRRG